ncbi:MAG: ATP-binding cassette domain-containing protein, partial [Candidatus Dormibacteraeota bacterium]|nr:ATP-binding cassette domain-containing protein [Candidatus Dormibacteraeota bacterium]
MAPLVDIAGLRYRYPESKEPALADVDLTLDGGLCVVGGPSGGGKSTLLRLFNGLVPHLYGGRIRGRACIDGRDVLRTATRHLATTVGFVFQDAERQGVYATVERDIAFGLENLGVPAPEMRRRVDAIAQQLGLDGLRGRSIATLSGGERQRVAVAGALVLRPRLLVLDEPFAQLDAPNARALLDICLRLRDGGTTLVIAEHRLDDLLPVADSLVTLADGTLTGPAAPSVLAESLDSAPQVVRLSRAMGWTPPLLSTDTLRLDTPLDGLQAQPKTGRPAWQLSGVVAGHGDLLIDVDASAAEGEVVVMMGRNGSGKTTLLRVIAGLIKPRSGSAWRVAGRVAYLPQNPAALLHRETVAAEIAWTMRGEPRADADDAAQRALLRTLSVDAIAARDPRDLSSGQRQRAAVAAILAGSPAVALLD